MIHKITRIMISTTISAFGTAMVLNSDLGSLALQALCKALCNWTTLPFWLINILVELSMIAYATYKGEGLGWTAIINGTYGAIMIAVFHSILPHHPLLILGGFLLPLSWSMMEKAGLGATGSNVLMIALMKDTNKSLTEIRLYQEGVQLLIGFLGARQYVSLFTIMVTFATPFIIKYVYKLTKHKPDVVEQQYIDLKNLRTMYKKCVIWLKQLSERI